MATSVSTNSVAPKIPSSAPRAWQSRLTRRRVAISLIAFTSLVLADMFVLGVRPRDILDLSDWGTLLGHVLVLMGLATRSWAAGTLHKCQSLNRIGPYALVRHPLYVGSLLMMVGFSTLVGEPLAIWLALLPIVGLYWLQVRYEEARLAQWFAADWPAYAAATPRFVPRQFPAAALQGWSLTQWLHNREYQALVASAAGLAGLVIWRSMAG